MTDQIERANLFASLHIKGDPLIIFNIWDAGTALAIQEIGAKAIATGSWAVAAANGYKDGEQIPLDHVILNLQRIVASVSLPVSLDVEGGYGRTPEALKQSIRRVIEAGAVGINFEDQIVAEEGLYSIDEQSARIAAIRQTADEMSVPFFINARTDVYLKAHPDKHGDNHLEEAVRRADAYAQAGASGFFAPGLRNAQRIESLCQRSPLPVNVMVVPNLPSHKQLAEMGVARISYGAGPYRQVMDALKAAGRAALSME